MQSRELVTQFRAVSYVTREVNNVIFVRFVLHGSSSKCFALVRFWLHPCGVVDVLCMSENPFCMKPCVVCLMTLHTTKERFLHQVI